MVGVAKNFAQQEHYLISLYKNHFALTFVLSLAWMCYLKPAVDASQILNKVKEKIT